MARNYKRDAKGRFAKVNTAANRNRAKFIAGVAITGAAVYLSSGSAGSVTAGRRIHKKYLDVRFAKNPRHGAVNYRDSNLFRINKDGTLSGGGQKVRRR